MKAKYLQWFLSMLMLAGPLFASGQGDTGSNVRLPRSIVVFPTERFGLVSAYPVGPGNTLYSISRSYHTDIAALRRLNGDTRIDQLNPGDTLLIPFEGALIDVKGAYPPGTGYIPVYYRTAPGDNLFRIARIYFDQQLEGLMQRNKLKEPTLKPGQLILIGWKDPGEPAPPQHQPTAQTPIEDQKTTEPETPPVKETQVKPLPERPIFTRIVKREEATDTPVKMSPRDSLVHAKVVTRKVHQNGLAVWNKTSQASGIFALHNEAKVGSLIEITNPLLHRKEFVRVIGKIPENSYPDNVKVILSPDAAKALGALDTRFYVKMNYTRTQAEH